MHNLGFALDGAWQVLIAGLLLGAGLPVIFSLGIRAQAWAASGAAAARPRPAGTALAWLCFGVVLLGVTLGITFIVASGFGFELTTDGITRK